MHHHRHTEWWCKFLYLMSLQYYVQVDGIWGPASLGHGSGTWWTNAGLCRLERCQA
jgi:hypothetical protein